MSNKSLLEQPLSSESVFSGRLLQVRRDRVRLPDGGESTREYVVHPGAVALVPVLPGGEILLVRQYRYPLRREFLEVPAGKMDPGEDPLVCGRRELLEETGYEAGGMECLCTIHPCIGYADERIVIYLARDLQFRGDRQDEDEFLINHPMSLEAALAAIRSGDITDAKTVTALFWAEKVLRHGWQGCAA